MARLRYLASEGRQCVVYVLFEVHVNASNMKTSSFAKNILFYGEFISPRTIKRI
jgi:hypothetical protein